MKTAAKILIALFITVFGFSEANAQWWGKRVKGNGNITTKTVNVGSYDGVRGVGSMDVHLERGTEGTIQVTTDDNIQEYVIIEVKDDILVVRLKKNSNVSTRKGIHVTVPFESISSVSLTGSGDVDTKDTIDSPEFTARVTGSGDVRLDINTGKLDAKVTGSGDIMLRGKAVDTEIRVSGSGDFKGESLESDNTDVSVSGSGDARVTAYKSLRARVAGSGDIRYKGSPDTSDTKVSGSGSIKSM